ncbi:two-component system, response regulator YesN [Paenibacillus sp. UNC496MF]|uniref:response regulator transcription factor n=1 Tax=Paenibacillus sp. UNC496MF TaxID=1502753 RepID=UPI0008E9204D|nr:response regulator transcription factor [Paenibacillus sp. UNC496MF]SFJ68149.1 two-component system, response regulator YesN [Paenibacillus sp. UNC496MF]
MYNVLITDDEPTIREGLRTLIDWEALGYRIVDTAANGGDALRKIERHRPDLLIVDIRMPGMSGLELVEAVRKTDSAVRVLILSGYADFDYAKKAIGLNIDGYLLKPVDEDELAEQLVRLRGELDRRRKELEESGARRAWNRQKLLHAMLARGEAGQERLPEPEALEALGLRWECYSIAAVKLQGMEPNPERFAAIRDRFLRAYDDKDKGVAVTMEAAIVLLLPADPASEAARRRVYADIAGLVAEPCAQIAAAAGSPVASLADVRRSYAEAAALLDRAFFYAGGELITASTAPLHSAEADGGGANGGAMEGGAAYGSEADPAAGLPALADKLFFAIDVGNAAAVAQLVEGLGRRLIAAGRSEEAIKTAFADLVAAAAGKLSHGGDDRKLDNARLSACMKAIYRHVRYGELERDLTETLPKLATGGASCSGDKQIKRMIDLIHRSYDENLKLETLAEVFNYNSAYLGKLFKSETGEYFNTYLDKVRIGKAKELLDQGLKIYQVAEKVGYANVDYFHGKFRKYVGVSPSAYRKK